MIWERQTPEWVIGATLLRNDNSVVTSSESGGTGYLLALNGAIGDEMWQTVVNGSRLSRPILGLKHRIFIGSGNGNAADAIRAFSPIGNPLWTSSAVAPGAGDHGAVGLGGFVYYCDVRGKVAAFGPADGTMLRCRDVGDARIFSPAIGTENQVIAGANDGVVRSYHPFTGNLLW